VKVSFWGEQIQVLKLLKLKKNDDLIFMDVKRKKNLFRDFSFESSVIKLD
jgi:hypothetical protein